MDVANARLAGRVNDDTRTEEESRLVKCMGENEARHADRSTGTLKCNQRHENAERRHGRIGKH